MGNYDQRAYGSSSKVDGNTLLRILVDKLIKKLCDSLENPYCHLC